MFGGVGLFSLPVEQTFCAINIVVHNFGVPSILGQKFQTFLECLQLEVGTNINPLTLEYSKYKHVVTDCWFTKLWERLERYKFSIHLFTPVIPLPQERDQLITDVFFELDCKIEEQQSLNRFRLKWERLFMSDIVTAGRRQLEKHILNPP